MKLKSWRVGVEIFASGYVDVEAENEDEASDVAHEKFCLDFASKYHQDIFSVEELTYEDA